MNFKTYLISIHACKEALGWVGDMTLEEAWATCPRGDWVLRLYATMHPENKRELTLVRGLCANTVRHLMTDNRSLAAVDAAIAYGKGKLTETELKVVAYAAAAYAAAYAAYRTTNQSETAEICRKYLTPLPVDLP